MTVDAPLMTAPASDAVSFGGKFRLFFYVAIIVLIAEFIGNITFTVGPGKIVLLPMFWALLMGAAVAILSNYLPPAFRVDVPLQNTASAILQPALFIFVAKLGLLVGASIPKLLNSGGALIFQEFGHFFGTMLFGLPVALLLGIKREAIGATFSVGREPNLAIIGEKFGMDSPEGRGVLAEYLTGTVFGAIFIALLAGFLSSLHIFHPLALAMGAGVGSGSMMAAASGAIAAQQTPEMAKEVVTFSAASNLITTTVGTYFTLFLSLPATIFSYRILEPILGRWAQPRTSDTPATSEPASQKKSIPLAFGELLVIWLAVGASSLIGNAFNYKTAPDPQVIEGMLIIVGAVVTGYGLYRLTGARLPAVIWVSLVGMALTYPDMPFSADVAALSGKINFLAMVTAVLAFAGLSIPKDLPAFRKLGWRIVVTSLMATTGTFIGATIIAQFLM